MKNRILGWEYEMIYLGGDPYNPEQAVIRVRTLKNAIVIRAADGKEESFHSLLIPYTKVLDVKLTDKKTGLETAIGEKCSVRAEFEKIALRYDDNGSICTLELCMSMAADKRQNSRLCRNMQEYVASRIKRLC